VLRECGWDVAEQGLAGSPPIRVADVDRTVAAVARAIDDDAHKV